MIKEDILLRDALETQKKIRKKVLKRLLEEYNRYCTNNLSDLILITETEIEAIDEEIERLENS